MKTEDKKKSEKVELKAEQLKEVAGGYSFVSLPTLYIPTLNLGIAHW